VRILTVHNYYQQPGGEDAVFEAEARVLREHGHEVLQCTEHNRQIDGGGPIGRLALAVDTVWSRQSHAKLTRTLAEFRPDVAHFHNTFPLVSPSSYYACRAAGVPVVQTLHNYRLGCPKATYYRNSRVCEDCRGKAVPWPGIVHACYHGSRSTTAVIAAMSAVHRFAGTWSGRVDAYIALSEFARAKFVQHGLPAEKVLVKGNFLDPDPGPGGHAGNFFLFAGRLTAEKGVHLLLTAWSQLADGVPLKIVGDGPLAGWVAEVTRGQRTVQWLGRQSPGDVHELMGQAAAVLVPSAWYEPFGLVAIEAFAKGAPVIAAGIGALPEIVEHGQTGLLHPANDPAALAEQVTWAWRYQDKLAVMGRQARQVFEQRYTRQQNYRRILEIYRRVSGAA
jgi:glycosyltransferase involved in cell wall biosynthesis